LLAEIAAFHSVVVTLRETQQGGDGRPDADSSALEAARLACAEMLYGNLGVLMDLYRATPLAVGDFYDLSIIRDGGSGVVEPPAPPTLQ
jgi:hypothetical protein